METIVSNRTLSVHKEHEFLQKMEAAGLTEKIAQKFIESKNNFLSKELIQKAEELIVQDSVFRVKPVATLENLEQGREFAFIAPEIREKQQEFGSTKRFKLHLDSSNSDELEVRLIFCTRKKLFFRLEHENLDFVPAAHLVALGINYPDVARICKQIMSLHQDCYFESDIDKMLKPKYKRGREFLSIGYHEGRYAALELQALKIPAGPTLGFYREKAADYEPMWFAVTSK